jgi:tRNA pseudouridine55 synthase
MAIIVLSKKIGETPNEMINNYIKNYNKNNQYQLKKGCTVGKLDPMASGISICLFDNQCSNMKDYLDKEKIYEFKIIFGIQSDSDDTLGLITNQQEIQDIDIQTIQKEILNFIGEYKQKYHKYSSICVFNKNNERNPLWKWTKENRLEEIEIPQKNVNVKLLEFLDLKIHNFNILKKIIIQNIRKVKGDFRQEKIIQRWKDISHIKNIFVGKFKIHCSSGFYVRQLVHDLCNKLQIYGIAYNINRTKIIL